MILKDIPFIDIHTHRRSEGYGTYGVHPWTLDASVIASEANPEGLTDQREVTKQPNLTLLEILLKENKIVAIGETGLDRYHKDTYNLQLEVFEQHISLSEQYQKPLIIHNVKATDDILKLHKKHHPSQPWIIHGFNGTTEEVRQLTTQGICLSVGESIFYPNRKITKSISSIPLEYLFLETDTSDKSIQEVYGKASELLNLPLETLKQQIFANFARLNLMPW